MKSKTKRLPAGWSGRPLVLKSKKPKPKLSTSSAKRRAWDAFSRYVRLRDAIETTRTKTHVRCCTCGEVYPAFGKGCVQAGHFIGGRNNSILFDERCVHGQCYVCNVHKKGASDEYWLFMEKKYGRGVIDELMIQKRLLMPLKVFELLEIEEKYLKKYEELQNG
jgi:hypothetical protein